MIIALIFLSSGLFFGWSLGANDASHIWGTAVATKMVRFKLAALLASVFVILGAVISGSGASHTLTQLGSINQIAGAFMVALSAGFSVFWMTRMKLPVSTSQAIVGSIVGWNIFAGMLTDYGALTRIVSSWIASLFLAAFFSFVIYKIVKSVVPVIKISIFRLDMYTRIGLIVIGSFGSYALGANNIANVMGIFIPISPFKSFNLGFIHVSGIDQLFLLGGLAIAVGVYTYSHRVMATVGKNVIKMSPQAALVVILSESLVLFLFSSSSLHNWLVGHGLPAIPLVPVSSSQLVIGAVVGIGIANRDRNIKLKVLGKIAMGWVVTPVMAAAITFVSLFFIQNVFDKPVYIKVGYEITPAVVDRLQQNGINIQREDFEVFYPNARTFDRALKIANIPDAAQPEIFQIAEVNVITVQNVPRFAKRVGAWFTPRELQSIRRLEGQTFRHKWELSDALEKQSGSWKIYRGLSADRQAQIAEKLEYLATQFRVNY